MDCRESMSQRATGGVPGYSFGSSRVLLLGILVVLLFMCVSCRSVFTYLLSWLAMLYFIVTYSLDRVSIHRYKGLFIIYKQ